jgi:hypothetical protein
MQGDENGSLVNIPSAFVSYSVGEKLLLALGSVPPWKPVLVTLNETGEGIYYIVFFFFTVAYLMDEIFSGV